MPDTPPNSDDAQSAPQRPGDARSPGEVGDPDQSGRQVGDYRLLTRLGRGGMADVYLAEQASLQRKVAFKVLKRSFAADDRHVRRFVQEARSAARLVHANIVQIHEVNFAEGLHYMVQEYLARGNLKQWAVRLGKPLSAAQAVTILRQVAAGLQKSRDEGIVHRDIKPENIMVGASGEIKVADFGLARVIEDRDHNLTRDGMTMGTPLYMSPERIEARPLDARSDIYSLGVTMWHMLAGRPPFQAETALALAMKHLRDEPPPLSVERPDLPPGLCRLVERMMAKDPDARPQTPEDILRALRALRAEGVDEETLEALDDIPTGDLPTAATGRLAATAQLAKMLKESRGEAPTDSTSRWGTWGLVAAGVAAGVVLAILARPKPLLDVEAKAVPKQGTVVQQLYHAQISEPDNPLAWQAVAKYFPESEGDDKDKMDRRRCALEADYGLARYYFDSAQYDRAEKVFSRLTRLDVATNRRLTAESYLGLAACRAKQGNLVEARKAMGTLKERKDDKALIDDLSPSVRGWLKDVEEAVDRQRPPA